MPYAIHSERTNEVIAVCPDRETADIIADRIGGRVCVRPIGMSGAAVALCEKPHAASEWAKQNRDPRDPRNVEFSWFGADR